MATHKTTARIEEALDRKQWPEARLAIQNALATNPRDRHWLLTMLGLTYYEEREYENTLRYTEEALKHRPLCPLALFHLAGALHMLGRSDEALAVWKRLLLCEVDDVAYGECGEGMDWALQLLNDCHYRMARCYQFLGQQEPARLAYLKYLHNRAHGVGSIYDASQAEKALTEVSQMSA